MHIESTLCNFFDKKWVKRTCFIIALVYSINFAFWGNAISDPFYFLKSFPDYASNFMTFGSDFIGYLWCELFGYTLLSMKLLGWIFNITAILVPYFFLQKRNEYNRNLYYLIFGIILLGYGTFNEFSFNTTTVLSIVGIITLLHAYTHNNKIFYLFYLGLLTALSVAFRFPNVLLVPIIVLYIFMLDIIEKKKVFSQQLMINLLIYFTSFVVIYVVIIFSILDSDYFKKGILFSISEENYGTHDINLMALRLWSQFVRILMFCGIFFLFKFLIEASSSKSINKVLHIFINLVILSLFAYFLITGIGLHKWWNYELHLFITAITICFSIVLCFKNLNDLNYKVAMFYISIPILGCVATLGSALT